MTAKTNKICHSSPRCCVGTRRLRLVLVSRNGTAGSEGGLARRWAAGEGEESTGLDSASGSATCRLWSCGRTQGAADSSVVSEMAELLPATWQKWHLLRWPVVVNVHTSQENVLPCSGLCRE